MVSKKARDELVAEDVDGLDELLDAESMTALRMLFDDLYAAHPVMAALADEQCGDRAARMHSEETNKLDTPTEGLDEEVERKKRLGGG